MPSSYIFKIRKGITCIKNWESRNIILTHCNTIQVTIIIAICDNHNVLSEHTTDNYTNCLQIVQNIDTVPIGSIYCSYEGRARLFAFGNSLQACGRSTWSWSEPWGLTRFHVACVMLLSIREDHGVLNRSVACMHYGSVALLRHTIQYAAGRCPWNAFHFGSSFSH